MSEYAAIAVFDNQNDGHYIRSTWGGMPDSLGVKLLQYYEDKDRACSLISLGDCYAVDRFIGMPFVPGRECEARRCECDPLNDEHKSASHDWSRENECCRAYMRDFHRTAPGYKPKAIRNGLVEFFNTFVSVDGVSDNWAEHLYAWVDGLWYYRQPNDPTGAWVLLRHAIRVFQEFWEREDVWFETWGDLLDWYEEQFHRVAKLGMPAP